MPVSSPTLKTAVAPISGSAASFDTASVSFTSGRLYFVVVHNNIAPTVGDPVVTSVSNTWAKIVGVPWDNQGSGNTRYLSVFRCISTATISEVVHIVLTGTGNGNCGWSVSEVASGFDTSGSNGSGAIGVSGSNNSESTATSGTVAALTLQNASSVVVSAWSHRAAELSTQKSGWSELSDANSSGGTQSLEVQFLLNDNAASASWTTSSKWAGVAFEIKLAPVGNTYTKTGMGAIG